MTIEQLIQILSNTLSNLNNARATAYSLGLLGELERIDAEIANTEMTLIKLKQLDN